METMSYFLIQHFHLLKTPVVELLAKTLHERGKKVAILSRGYKSHDLENPQDWDCKRFDKEKNGLPKIVSNEEELLLNSHYAGDEPYMLAKNLKGVPVVVDRDRVKSGRFAVSEFGADVLILDDGLQYLKLSHEIDLVLVDSQKPFGLGWMLPRGILREPPKNLCRASYIFLTKCRNAGNEELIQEIRKYNKTAEIIECAHGPRYFENVFTGEKLPLSELKGKWVGAMSGIAVPESFEAILTDLGATVGFHRVFPDHHTFTQKEIDDVMERALKRDADWVVTTEKDAVRFPKPTELDVPVYFLRIEVEILSGEKVWDKLVDRLCVPATMKDRFTDRLKEAAAIL